MARRRFRLRRASRSAQNTTVKEENYFDARIAASYDAASSEMFEPAVLGPTVEFLAGLAGDGAALEFAIGTGRVALPLSARGVSVHGIELSPDMAAQLRAKPGADAIAVTMGDMATARVDATFRLVYLVFNGIGNLVTQEAQVSCFQNAAAHLDRVAASSSRTESRPCVACHRVSDSRYSMRCHRTSASTKSMSHLNAAFPIITGSRVAVRKRPRSRGDSHGPPSSTSWRASPA